MFVVLLKKSVICITVIVGEVLLSSIDLVMYVMFMNTLDVTCDSACVC